MRASAYKKLITTNKSTSNKNATLGNQPWSAVRTGLNKMVKASCPSRIQYDHHQHRFARQFNGNVRALAMHGPSAPKGAQMSSDVQTHANYFPHRSTAAYATCTGKKFIEFLVDIPMYRVITARHPGPGLDERNDYAAATEPMPFIQIFLQKSFV